MLNLAIKANFNVKNQLNLSENDSYIFKTNNDAQFLSRPILFFIITLLLCLVVSRCLVILCQIQ